MEPLEKELLLQDVARYGYQLVSPSSSSDPARVLHKMLTSDDGRVLEGVPVVLTNILLSNPEFDLEGVERDLPSALQKRFRLLAAVTCQFIFWVEESDLARKSLQKYLKKREPSVIESVKEKLQSHHKIPIGGGVILDEDRLEKTYRNYVVEQMKVSETNVARKLEDQRSTMLDEALTVLFTDKQKDLMIKLLNREPLTKTDREYYSRVIKPRLKALRNPDLQTMAATLLGF